MTLDLETKKWLNLLRSSPSFVLKDKPDGGAQVVSPQRVPASDGFYWVHGETVLPSGKVLESVFHLDTNSGGELHEVYWWIDGSWYDHRNTEALALLGPDAEISPFDWSYSVPLENDVFHG